MQAGPGPRNHSASPIPPGGTGAAAALFDWAQTPLGPREAWPQSLKTAAQIVLGSNVPMALCWGPELRLIHNDAYGEILGDRRPALGKPIKEVWSDAWARVESDVARILAGETVFNEAAERPLKQGGVTRTAWLSVCYTPVRDESGAVAGIFATVIGENQNAAEEQRLQESEERFRLIADSAPAPIWVTRLDRRRAFVNRAYLDFVGGDYEAALAFDWRTILHPDDAPRVLAESLAGETSLKTFALEARYRSGTGEWRWLRSISQPRFGPSGEHVGFIGVAQDITEWKLGDEVWRKANERLEERVAARTADLRAALDRLQAEVGERERAEEALRQAQKMEAVGRLTGGIAHDFNNLLTPVIGGLEVIAGAVAEPRLKRLADAALESGRRGAKLTSQLLAFSRIQRLRMAPVAVDRVIANLGRILRHTIGPDIEIRTELGAEAFARCDENQLENAIINLAINARDAMPKGGVLTITTKLVEEPSSPELEGGSYVRIGVADTGHGMASEVAARALEPFFTTKAIGKGTGLGLAQVYGVTRQAGGTVRIDSREGSGSRVEMLFPHVDASGNETDASAAGTANQEGAPPARILVADDDEDVREFLVEALADLGHEVRRAPDGPSALALIGEERPDLLVADFAMPGMNGAELARAAREKRPGLPILFVTGYAESEQLEAGLADVPVLRKPFGIAELAAAVRAALSQNASPPASSSAASSAPTADG